jgi:hypothetical protein
MGKPLQGSICISDIKAAQLEEHSAFRVGKDGKTYLNLTLWVNEKPDEYGNTMALQVNPAKDSPDKKFYIGNFKELKQDVL